MERKITPTELENQYLEMIGHTQTIQEVFSGETEYGWHSGHNIMLQALKERKRIVYVVDAVYPDRICASIEGHYELREL